MDGIIWMGQQKRIILYAVSAINGCVYVHDCMRIYLYMCVLSL